MSPVWHALGLAIEMGVWFIVVGGVAVAVLYGMIATSGWRSRRIKHHDGEVPMRWTVLLVVVLLVGLLPAVADAHKEKLPKDALSLVRQAVALLSQNPAMTAEVQERLEAALASSQRSGVHLDQVAQALRALNGRDTATARRLLAAAIMPAGMPMPPREVAQLAPQPPMGDPQTLRETAPARSVQPASADELMKMAEPLTPRFGGSAAEFAVLAGALILLVAGAALLRTGRKEAAR